MANTNTNSGLLRDAERRSNPLTLPLEGEAVKKSPPPPPSPRRCEKIRLGLFPVIPAEALHRMAYRAEARTQYFRAFKSSLDPVFTGVTTKGQLFHTFPEFGGEGKVEGLFLSNLEMIQISLSLCVSLSAL